MKIIPHLGWYIICSSKDVTIKPTTKLFHGTPIVLFRNDLNRLSAFIDRCPHRNLPLSLGEKTQKGIRCAYHGWEFSSEGECVHIPGLLSPNGGKKADTFEVVEQQGFVWIWSEPNQKPTTAPFAFPNTDQSDYKTIQYQAVLTSQLFDALENALDVPHTAFLHKGLFRKTINQKIQVTLRKMDDRAEAVYEGEPRPSGWIGTWLAPNQNVEHTDRFILPSIAQVEYKMGKLHILSTTAYTPRDEKTVEMFALSSFRLRLPSFLIGAIALPIAKKILNQDATILRKQQENVQSFGKEQYAYTPADILGPTILQMLRGVRTVGEETRELIL